MMTILNRKSGVNRIMECIVLIGIALTLFIPPIVSIILGGASIGKRDMEIGKQLWKK